MATDIGGSIDGPSGSPANESAVSAWITQNASPGRILSVGESRSGNVDAARFDLVTVTELAWVLDYKGLFAHAWVGITAANAADPAKLVQRVYDAVKPGGQILITAPFGAPPNGYAAQTFYLASMRRLVDPLFEVTKAETIDGYIGIVGIRRPDPEGQATFSLDADERAFHAHEARLNRRFKDQAAQLVRSGALYRSAIARAERLQRDLDRTVADLTRLRQKVARIRPLYVVPLTVVRRVRRLRSAGPAQPAIAAAAHSVSTVAQVATVHVVGGLAEATDAAPHWRDVLRRQFDEWIEAARAAEGDEVVVMFSGTTFIQEHRANRPIRLTRVYLERKCPVFFNYYRWHETDALPDHSDPLVFQSPIDATPMFFDALLNADFGGKKKIFFASFPHELMVRYLTVAAQAGWVTVYDARDDWEEFAKVGMAKWYHPGYERYVAVHADVVSAVSRPLARKMSALAGGRTVHVNPNGLDPKFPRPTGPRHTTGTPVVGYFGHLTDKWFDWPLVIAAAKRYPDFVFELAGHQAPTLDLPSNVKLLGMLGHADLAERSRSWAVAIIPFKNSPLADAVDPIKIYEYLHLGVPTLATYFPQCRDYPGTTITEGPDEFLKLLPQVARTTVAQPETAQWLTQNTWECRVDTYSAQADEVRQSSRSNAMAMLGVSK